MKNFTESEQKEILQQFVDAWGEDAEKMMAIEEMSELTKELCKSWRGATSETPESMAENKQNIIEETADVLITVNQIRLMYGEKEVDDVMDQKLARGLRKLEEWKAANDK